MGFGETLCDGIDLDFMEDGNSDEETWMCIRFVSGITFIRYVTVTTFIRYVTVITFIRYVTVITLIRFSTLKSTYT
jgi:hypothetical protein